MSRPTGRVLTLLELLQAGGTRTMADLADRLGVDPRTVRRYIDHLVDLGVPVESERGRYGGYRLGPGYRLPPLMLTDDEALAVLLGLVAGRRGGLAPADRTAGETASAKIRRVLPKPAARRLDALLETLAVTGGPEEAVLPDADALLAVAEAIRHRRPLSFRYTDREGRRTKRTAHPDGLVAHEGRWYVTAVDAEIDEPRTFRLDRIADVRALPGTFEPPTGPDPADRLVTGFATAGYRFDVALRMQGTASQIRARLPATVAVLEDLGSLIGDTGEPEPWHRVRIRAERLDWLPAVLAAADRPFVIERPDELRALVLMLAERLAASVRG